MNLAGNLDTVQRPGYGDVEQDDIGNKAANRGNRGRSVIHRGDYIITKPGNHTLEIKGDDRFVLCNKDLCSGFVYEVGHIGSLRQFNNRFDNRFRICSVVLFPVSFKE